MEKVKCPEVGATWRARVATVASIFASSPGSRSEEEVLITVHPPKDWILRTSFQWIPFVVFFVRRSAGSSPDGT